MTAIPDKNQGKPDDNQNDNPKRQQSQMTT
jgi:hypothetical protein